MATNDNITWVAEISDVQTQTKQITLVNEKI